MSDVFHKGKTLYNIDLAQDAITKERGELFIAEGYFDVLELMRMGAKSAVGLMGSGLTDEQMKLIGEVRHANDGKLRKITLVPDNDEAGRNWAYDVGERLKDKYQEKCEVQVMFPPAKYKDVAAWLAKKDWRDGDAFFKWASKMTDGAITKDENLPPAEQSDFFTIFDKEH